jgi:hypothetical protein
MRKFNRRQFLGVLIGGASVIALKNTRALANSEPELYCSWVLRETRCRNGRIQERWCYMCCDGNSCAHLVRVSRRRAVLTRIRHPACCREAIPRDGSRIHGGGVILRRSV